MFLCLERRCACTDPGESSYLVCSSQEHVCCMQPVWSAGLIQGLPHCNLRPLLLIRSPVTTENSLSPSSLELSSGAGCARCFQIREQACKALNPCGEIYCASWQQLRRGLTLCWAEFKGINSGKSGNRFRGCCDPPVLLRPTGREHRGCRGFQGYPGSDICVVSLHE